MGTVRTSSGEVMRFSTASTTPSVVWIPTAVEPSLIASMAYSTYRTPRSRSSALGPFLH